MFGKVLINVSRDLQRGLYLGTNFMFEIVLIIRDSGSIYLCKKSCTGIVSKTVQWRSLRQMFNLRSLTQIFSNSAHLVKALILTPK
jgi:hypothetical protein